VYTRIGSRDRNTCTACKNEARIHTSDIVAAVRRLIAERFRIERSAKRHASQASEADVDRRFRLSPASLWILPSAVFRRDLGNRVAGTSYPTQTPPLTDDIVSRAGNPNKPICPKKHYTTKDTKYHEGRTSSHCGLNPAANAPLHHPLRGG
jgi:hypothetical protein